MHFRKTMQSVDWRMDWKWGEISDSKIIYGGCFYLPAWSNSAISLNRYKSSNHGKNEGIRIFSTEASFQGK